MAYAFLSYEIVPTTGRRCLLGAFLLSRRPCPLMRVPHDIRERNTEVTELWSEVIGISAKSIQIFENMGGVGAPVRALGIHGPTSTRTGTPPDYASHDPTVHSFPASRATEKDSPDLVIMIKPPAGEPEGLQSTVSLEDGQRILGKDNIFSRYPRENFLHSTWLPLKDKVLVSSSRSSTLSGSQT